VVGRTQGFLPSCSKRIPASRLRTIRFASVLADATLRALEPLAQFLLSEAFMPQGPPAEILNLEAFHNPCGNGTPLSKSQHPSPSRYANGSLTVQLDRPRCGGHGAVPVDFLSGELTRIWAQFIAIGV